MTEAPRRGRLSGRAVSVLLVEDHRIFADVVATRLRAEDGVVEVRVAASVGEARASLDRWSADVVLVDLGLDGESGLDLVEELASGAVAPKVLVLTGSADAEHLVRALASGADGWITKTAPFDELVRAVGCVHAGQMFLEERLVRPVVSQLLLSDPARRDDDVVLGLTPRQRDVLRCLVSGLSRAETAERLHLSANTVRTHVQALLRRAGVHSSLALAARAREAGLPGIDEPDGPRESARG